MVQNFKLKNIGKNLSFLKLLLTELIFLFSNLVRFFADGVREIVWGIKLASSLAQFYNKKIRKNPIFLHQIFHSKKIVALLILNVGICIFLLIFYS